jgi:hypothetical protein
MSKFRLKDVPRWCFIKSQNCYLIDRRLISQQFVHCWKIRAILQNTLYFAELLSKILPEQIRAQTRYHIWASFIHVGLFSLTQDMKTTIF